MRVSRPSHLRPGRGLRGLAAVAMMTGSLAAGTGVYLIRPILSGGAYALAAERDPSQPGPEVKVVLRKADPKDPLQQWRLVDTNGAGTRIQQNGTLNYLVGGMGGIGSEAVVRNYSSGQGSPNEMEYADWHFSSLNPGTEIFIRRFRNDGHHLDVFGDGGWKVGSKVGIWRWNNAVNQKFRLEEVPEGDLAQPDMKSFGLNLPR